MNTFRGYYYCGRRDIMSYAHELWPISGKSFFDIDNQSYLVHIKWSRNLKSDYQRLSENFLYVDIRYVRR